MKKLAFFGVITTGSLKGRKIILPNAESTRPTRDRLRQAIFNMLNSRLNLPGLTVVDLCCGSGALGLEAFSRGAAATLVDTDITITQRNAQTLQAGVQVVRADARTWTPPSPFDVILADPPYGSRIAQALLARRTTLGKPGSWWVVETGSDETLNWEGFTDVRERTYGVSKIGIAKQL